MIRLRRINNGGRDNSRFLTVCQDIDIAVSTKFDIINGYIVRRSFLQSCDKKYRRGCKRYLHIIVFITALESYVLEIAKNLNLR